MGLLARWMQPIQQHGRRMTPFIFDSAFSILIERVSAFFPDVIQHIHSLRARGVMSPHSVATLLSEAMAFFKSAGIACIRL